MQMKVSVVIPSCSGRKNLWACLPPLNHQILDSSHEAENVTDERPDDEKQSAAQEFALTYPPTSRTHVSGRASARIAAVSAAVPGFPRHAASAGLPVIDRTGATAPAAAARRTEPDGEPVSFPSPLAAESGRAPAACSLTPGFSDAACRH
ncbi:hypothetical protein ACGH2B_29035 [Streptomyces sp. BBFR2]|uniref:hypothetical protein n=1 Tax=Streptomyces sp. BBFR2 TaxID=3372854 RepID=UPI0037DA7227